MKTLFIDRDGVAHDFGATAPDEFCNAHPVYDGTRYLPLGAVNGVMLFGGVADEEYEAFRREAERRGAGFVGVTDGAAATGAVLAADPFRCVGTADWHPGDFIATPFEGR